MKTVRGPLRLQPCRSEPQKRVFKPLRAGESLMRPVVLSNVSRATHAAEKKSSEGVVLSRLTRLRVLLCCVVLMGSAYLRQECSRAYCSDQRAELPVAGTTTAKSAAVVESTKRPVTVADSIQMTRLGDPSYTDGAPSKGIVAKFSPDGKRFVVVLKKGNL